MRLCLLVLVGCGSVKAEDTPDASDPTAAPTIVSVSPANMAAGVLPDAKIVVTFSKPMNQASVEAAWSSADLPAGTVSFSWSSSDTFTVTPNQPLPVAEGTGLDPSTVTARRITFSIGGDAADMNGKSLAAPLAVAFTTIRRLSHDVTIIDALTQSLVNDGTVISPPSGGVGDTTFSNTYFRVCVSFLLPALPAGAQIETAVMSGAQQTIQGSPYTKLGALKAQHVSFAAIDVNTFSATPLGTSGDFSTTATIETKSLDVTTSVQDDYANAAARGNRSQYRLEFTTGTNNDGVRDLADFSRTSFKLKLTYHVE